MPSVERLTTTAGSEACEHTPLPRHARVNEPCRPMPECMMHLCGGASSIAAVRSSCAFRAALPASGTNRRCGRCVYGGECARHERRLSRVRDIKFLEGGTSRARPAPAVSWCRAGVAGERARTWRASMGPTERSPVNERAGWHDEWVEREHSRRTDAAIRGGTPKRRRDHTLSLILGFSIRQIF